MKEAVVRRMRNPSAESEGALARLGRLARERFDGEVDAEREVAERARLLAALYPPVQHARESNADDAAAPAETNEDASSAPRIVRRKSLR
jgi:hypothetical protein